MHALRAATHTLLRTHCYQSATLLTRASPRARTPPSSAPTRALLSRTLTPVPSVATSLPATILTPPAFTLEAAAVGFASGALGALCGVGGAVFAIPGLVRFAAVPQRVAAGTALVAVTAIAATSTASFATHNHIDWTAAAALATPAALLTPLGAVAAARASPHLLRRGLGLFMILLAPVMPLRVYLERNRGNAVPDNSLEAPLSPPPPKAPQAALSGIGAAVGFVSGLLGISGGSLFTPVLAVVYTDAPFRTVLGTSFAAMIVPTAVGAVSYARMGCVAPQLLPPLVAGAVVGAAAGSAAALAVPEDTLRWVFAVVLTVLGARIVRAPIKVPCVKSSSSVSAESRRIRTAHTAAAVVRAVGR